VGPRRQPADLRRITRLVAELDSEEFAVRERATTELTRLGAAAQRALQMLELLERIGTPAARELLKHLADNGSDVWLAREAQAVEARLRRRQALSPRCRL
jgi:hypothetical protein